MIMRKMVAAVMALVLTASPALAASISLEWIWDRGGGNLEEYGLWATGKTETIYGVTGYAQKIGGIGGGQITSFGATVDPGSWDVTLTLVAGTYDCWGKMYYVDGGGNSVNITSNTIRGTI
jgi:hypothetical protein